MKLLEGEVKDPQALRIAQLETELRQARRELSDAQVDAERARADASRALSMLRRQLSPLYRALQAVFGELDAAGVTDEAPSATHAPETSAAGRSAKEMALWSDWKAKLPPGCGKVIDALLLHSDLNVKQLKVAAKMGENSVYQATSRLGQAGLINKNGGRFSLKQL